MAHLPSKKVIWLVVVLVAITIALLWFVGYQSKKDKTARQEQYFKEFLAQQKNIEAVAVNGMINEGEKAGSPIEKLPNIIVSTSTASSTAKQLRDYGLAVIKAFEPLENKRENEAQAVVSAIDKNDPGLLQAVVASRIYHQVVVQNMSRIVVPKEMLLDHKKIIDQLNFISSILGNMAKALDEPESALNNSRSFVANYDTLLKLIDKFDQDLTKMGVTFQPQEKLKIFISYL